jgi:FG-GAP repeat
MKTARPAAFLLFFTLLSGAAIAQVQQLAELTASDGVTNFYFGSSVAISGNTAVVGAPGGYDVPGAAYVFVNSGGVWQQTAKLVPESSAEYDLFGESVAIDGNLIVVGGPAVEVGPSEYGAAFLFVGSGSNWRSAGALVPSDVFENGFGDSVAISGDTVVVGRPGGGNDCGPPGAIYLYVNPVGHEDTITETAILTQSDGQTCGELGTSVAISGSTVLGGAPFTYGQEGTAYVFVEPQNGWTSMTQTAKLVASNIVSSDHFGTSVALSANGKTALAGAPGFYDPQGAAYVFVEPEGRLGRYESDSRANLRQCGRNRQRGRGCGEQRSHRSADLDRRHKPVAGRGLRLCSAFRWLEVQFASECGTDFIGWCAYGLFR